VASVNNLLARVRGVQVQQDAETYRLPTLCGTTSNWLADMSNSDVPVGLKQFLRKKIKESLDGWIGSEEAKLAGCELVVCELERSVIAEVNAASSSLDCEERSKQLRKELNDKGVGVAQMLKGRSGDQVIDLLTLPLDVIGLFKSNVEHKKRNREMFDSIVGRHKRLATLVDSGRPWAEVVDADVPALHSYAKAATEMGQKQWVKVGHQWILSAAFEFFQKGGARKHFLKVKRKQYFEKNGLQMPAAEYTALGSLLEDDDLLSSSSGWKPLQVLDVGSCYNPFAGESRFEVTALDLMPTSSSVYSCDFLALEVGPVESTPIATLIDPSSEATPSAMRLERLPRHGFDIVTMSLVLSYLPSPQHRLEMIVKARELLKPPDQNSQHPHRAGILLIMEKESCLAAADLLDHWKCTIQDLGFQLIRYNLVASERRKAHAFAFVRSDDSFMSNKTVATSVEGLRTRTETET